MSEKEQTKTGQMIKDHGRYDYEASDGTTIKLRALSEREREEILSEDYAWALGQLVKGMAESDRELYLKGHRQFTQLIGVVGFDREQAIAVSKWSKRIHMGDVVGLMNRIMDVEGAAAKGDPPPDQLNLLDETKLDSDSPSELEAKGEDSPGDTHIPTT